MRIESVSVSRARSVSKPPRDETGVKDNAVSRKKKEEETEGKKLKEITIETNVTHTILFVFL